MGSLTTVGYHSTLTRTWDAGDFSLLTVGDGGAIYNDGHMYVSDSGFLDNSTGGYGGAMYTGGTLKGDHITITANVADADGGAADLRRRRCRGPGHAEGLDGVREPA